MAELSYSSSLSVEELEDTEINKLMKKIEWKQMKQLEPGLKQTEGGKPSYSASDRLNLSWKCEFKGRLN